MRTKGCLCLRHGNSNDSYVCNGYHSGLQEEEDLMAKCTKAWQTDVLGTLTPCTNKATHEQLNYEDDKWMPICEAHKSRYIPVRKING